MNSFCIKPFLLKVHDLITFETFYLKEQILRMMLKMTQPMPNLERTKPKAKPDLYCTPHLGQKVHVWVHSEPKPNIKGNHHKNL